jgi:hypothetical protein
MEQKQKGYRTPLRGVNWLLSSAGISLPVASAEAAEAGPWQGSGAES